MSTNLTRIGDKARAHPDLVFTSLYHHIADIDHLRAWYRLLQGKKAVGVDEVTKAMYAEDLETNLQDLSARLTRMGYRPQPKRRTYMTLLVNPSHDHHSAGLVAVIYYINYFCSK
jgi:RNA-directed DNA polymerase